MHYAVTSEQMKALDAHTIKDMGIPSLVLMERAALCTVEEIREPLFSKDRILLVCGSGNNGADGVALVMEGNAMGGCDMVHAVEAPHEIEMMNSSSLESTSLKKSKTQAKKKAACVISFDIDANIESLSLLSLS